MSRSASLALGAIGLALACAEADAAQIGKSFQVGNWRGGAFASDRTKRFTHCAASSSYKNGVGVLFMVTGNYRWAIGFTSDNFSVRPDSTVKLALSLDGAAPTLVEAYAIDSNFLRVSLDPKASLFRRFKAAHFLELRAKDLSYKFALTDTSRMLPQLLQCVTERVKPTPMQADENRQVASATERQTSGVRSGSSSAYETSRDVLRAEATSVMANLLSEAGINGFRLVPGTSENGVPVDVIWASPVAKGAMFIVTDKDVRRPRDMNAKLIAVAAESCKGKFALTATPETDSSSAARVVTGCQVGQKATTTYYLTLPRQKGGHYVFATFSDDDSEPAKEVERDIRSAAFRVIK